VLNKIDPYQHCSMKNGQDTFVVAKEKGIRNTGSEKLISNMN